mgnify:CR=1
MAKHLKEFWRKLDLLQKRDLLIKYYPNPSRKWSVTNQMILDIYDKEVTNKSI